MYLNYKFFQRIDVITLFPDKSRVIDRLGLFSCNVIKLIRSRNQKLSCCCMLKKLMYIVSILKKNFVMSSTV